MSDKSPLFVSALELMAHAVEIYASNDPKKNKFVILHLANAIELILKDCLVDQGISIYKHPKETISIWSAISEIENLSIEIPMKPIIELLIDDRNTIQHRFGYPSAETTFYYLEKIAEFFKKFIRVQYRAELSLVLESYLNKDNIALIGLIPEDHGYFKKLFELSPEAAITQAVDKINKEVESLFDFKSSSNAEFGYIDRLLLALAKNGFLSEGVEGDYQQLKEARNVAFSKPGKSSEIAWDSSLQTAIKILDAISELSHTNHVDSSGNYSYLKTLFNLSPQLAIQQGLSDIENQLDRIRLRPIWRLRRQKQNAGLGAFEEILYYLSRKGYLPDEAYLNYQGLKKTAKDNFGYINSSKNSDSEKDFHEVIQILAAMERAIDDGIFSGRITEKIKDIVFARCEGKCTICGSSENLEIHHIIPIAEGGDSGIDNLQVVCDLHNN
ncbi:HNH endonuclease [Nodosilinea nodulosa]|uniref:HNH endonuclease n=1 Tax=Nodosilinea nodulosa TaxID=416001 RepID=UPI0002E1302F|nr:HNH endonuclease signature motif containing protein [Nodosilinea nodulosa]